MGIIFLVVLVDMMGFGIIIPFLTYMVEDLAGGDVPYGRWVAALMAAYSGAMFLFSPVWGALSDRIGRRPVLMFGLLGNSFAFIVFGLSNSLWMALAARIFAGMVNANISVARAFIGDISEPHEVAKRQGILGVAFGVGFSIGPALGGVLSAPAEWGWTSVFADTIFETYPYFLPCLASALFSFAGFIFAALKLEESLPTEERGGIEKRSPIKTLKTNLTNLMKMYRRPVIAPLLWSMTFFWIGFTIMHVVFILFTMLPMTGGGFGFSEQQNGWVFTFIGVVGIITQGGLIGPLTKRFGSSNLMIFGILTCGVGLGSIPYVPSHLGLLGLLPVMGLVALGNGMVTPSNMAMLTHVSGKEERGAVMGVSESLRALSTFTGVLLGGWVWDATVNNSAPFDFHTAFRLCAIFSALALITFRFSGAWKSEEKYVKTEVGEG